MVSALNNSKSASMSSVISDMGWTALFTRGLGLRVAMIGTLTGTLLLSCTFVGSVTAGTQRVDVYLLCRRTMVNCHACYRFCCC